MPDMFVSNGYKNQLNNQAFDQSHASAEDYQIGLFTNNVTISDTTVIGSLTEATWTSYARVSLPRSALTAAALTGNISYLGTTVVPQFTNGTGSGVTTYGWFMVGVSSGLLVAAQNFSGAPVTIAATNVLTLYPFQIGLESF